ncbi:uncharacterized protein LAESUDRAFT_692923 [Laetiporus sulphureus 93-53]|uniref:Uncharacterized protein n=1 Tax=Laetiporus sulphureus 93-53 TaxID=1314785 RepID=A0A165GQM5_9APHY|nr:uncharacterized protein LAESUDRAFT_692923 [Laetiporus sulphureus 93-53]KZT10671.1 hypothetical protein LAESUDRAFT_692923 [Laetiporus sulphureus 93-53]
MSRSTTATTTYTLVKYSRSYGQHNASGENNEQEWQHFTNPVIHLVVDVKKTSKGDLESFRTRILWSLGSGNDSMDIDQREIVFEDLDLLTFSLPASLQQRQITPQGLPLKAVYRDAVIGIRYLHPRHIPSGGTPSYRRFQVTFQAASEASAFIDSIKYICPCKANPVPAPARLMARTATTTQAGSAIRPQPASGLLTLPAPSTTPSSMRIQPPATQVETFNKPGLMSANVSEYPHPQFLPSATALPLDHPTSDPTYSTARLAAAPSSAVAPAINVVLDRNSPMAPPSLSSNVMPPSTPVTDSQAATATNVQQHGLSQDLVTALQETAPLYDLPRADLEALVARVVCEDGFAQLLENIDCMWRVKGFLGRF